MINKNPRDEQDLCVACGFCCDHTLFEYAYLKPGEAKEEHFQKGKFVIEENDYFLLPCPYFKGCCSIYDQQKPLVCSAFKCKLLKNFANGDIEKSKALSIIEQAKQLRSEVIEQYQAIVPEIQSSYRDVLRFVNEEQTNNSNDFSVLKAKANLLSILLIRYFKSKETFDELLKSDNV